MNERALANNARIQIIEQIADVDLPWFLFEHIDQSLVELNYYKLTNLLANLDDYVSYLQDLAHQYSAHLLELATGEKHPHMTMRNFESLMTEKVFQHGVHLSLTKQQIVNLKSLFSVSCLLTMKEFINRRILHKNVTQTAPKNLKKAVKK